jgi:hypothetical protein
MFLDSIRERQEEEERQRKEKDGEEVKNFRECAFFHLPTTYPMTHFSFCRAVAARANAANNAAVSLSASSASSAAKPKPPVVKRDVKKVLKGVVVKKKAKPPTVDSSKTGKKDKTQDPSKGDDAQRDVKRRKVAS